MVQRVKSHHYRGQLQSGFQRAGPQISFYVTCYSSLLSDYDFSRCGLRQYQDRQGGVILFASLGSPIIVTPGSHALIICIHGICWGIILFTFDLKNHPKNPIFVTPCSHALIICIYYTEIFSYMRRSPPKNIFNCMMISTSMYMIELKINELGNQLSPFQFKYGTA